MNEPVPKVATRLALTLFGGTGLFLIGLALYRRSWELLVVFSPLCLLCSLGLLRALSTRVSSTEVSQITWRGQHSIAWTAITEVKARSGMIELSGDGVRVVLPLVFFRNHEETYSYVATHVPSHLRGLLS